jgi:hypothetical protein
VLLWIFGLIVVCICQFFLIAGLDQCVLKHNLICAWKEERKNHCMNARKVSLKRLINTPMEVFMVHNPINECANLLSLFSNSFQLSLFFGDLLQAASMIIEAKWIHDGVI